VVLVELAKSPRLDRTWIAPVLIDRNVTQGKYELFTKFRCRYNMFRHHVYYGGAPSLVLLLAMVLSSNRFALILAKALFLQMVRRADE